MTARLHADDFKQSFWQWFSTLALYTQITNTTTHKTAIGRCLIALCNQRRACGDRREAVARPAPLTVLPLEQQLLSGLERRTTEPDGHKSAQQRVCAAAALLV